MAFDAVPDERSTDDRILLHARGLLAKGWCQGTMAKQSPDGGMQFCTMGALQRATNEAAGHYGSSDAHRLAQRLGFANADLAVRFNDHPHTTQAHVLARFDAALEGKPLPVPVQAPAAFISGGLQTKWARCAYKAVPFVAPSIAEWATIFDVAKHQSVTFTVDAAGKWKVVEYA